MKSEKNGIITLLLAFFLGFLGFHRFYVGKIGTGILMLFSFGGLFIWWIIDIIMVVLDKFEDKKGQTIKVEVIDRIFEIVGYETEASKLKARAQLVGLPKDATLQEVEAAEKEEEEEERRRREAEKREAAAEELERKKAEWKAARKRTEEEKRRKKALAKKKAAAKKKRLEEKQKRRKRIIKKYGEKNAAKVLNGELFIDMTKAMLRDAIGSPSDKKETVTKNKTTKKYYYNPRENRQKNTVYGLEVTLTDDVVSGWKDL